MLEEKKEWTEPTVTELDIAEQTQNVVGDGPDGGTMEQEGEPS